MTHRMFETRYFTILIIFFSAILMMACNRTDSLNFMPGSVQTGAEVLIEQHLEELEDKRVGLVMNPTARIGDTHLLDTLLTLDVQITSLFAPEHGFRGEAGAGDVIEDGIDTASGLPVYSLYGENRKPTGGMLTQVDVLIFDMQDVGARFYTYIATLGLVMEAASEHDVEIWVLDRPNPLGGDYVSGWILDDEFESFVGPYPIPIAHGLTMGEMARMIAGEGWMNFETEPKLRVIEMEGWSRKMRWPETGLSWVPPSPNLPTFEHAFMYPGTVFFEGTSLSEGRGTDHPFLTLGAPNTSLDEMDWDSIASLKGLRLIPHSFTPRSIPGVAPNPKHLDSECKGVFIEVNSFESDPVRSGLELFRVLVNATPDAVINPFLYRLAGSREIDKILSGDEDPNTVDFNLDSYLEQRKPYLLYN
jgi:uncharacterized protein YbbC (DUF1343 family)